MIIYQGKSVLDVFIEKYKWFRVEDFLPLRRVVMVVVVSG